MLTKDEQDALDKVVYVFSRMESVAWRSTNSRDSAAIAAAELTQAWALFAKEVEKNN
jgi:hypothetical protein